MVADIPMAALVAVMIMVSVGTMDWHSIHPATLRRMPRSETIVMLATVVVTVVSHNLAYGVIVGSMTAMVLFARRVAHFMTVQKVVETDADGDGVTDSVVYRVNGELFFASSNDLVYQFDYNGDPANVVIDMSDSHIWDASTCGRPRRHHHQVPAKGKNVALIGMNDTSAERHAHLSPLLAGAHSVPPPSQPGTGQLRARDRHAGRVA